MSEQWNVLIVGGGPAGLAAGEAAAKLGVRTLIVERQHEIGYPIHTSGGSWISDIQALHIPHHLYHPINTVYFVSRISSRAYLDWERAPLPRGRMATQRSVSHLGCHRDYYHRD